MMNEGYNPQKNEPSLSEADDAMVIDQASQGSQEAFGVLYERYVNRIYNYIYYRTGNVHEAEDLTGRVFHRAMGHIKTYRNMGIPFAAYLYRIAHNLVANWHRDQQRRREVPLEEYVEFRYATEHPEASLVQNQEREVILKIIRKFPAERQHLLILKFVEDLPNAEIAVIMGRSEGAIKSLYHRTLLALRDQLENADLFGEL